MPFRLVLIPLGLGALFWTHESFIIKVNRFGLDEMTAPKDCVARGIRDVSHKKEGPA